MPGIILSIEIDDKGTVKVKQFADETKKAFDEMKKGPEQAKGPLASFTEGWVGITAKITAATAVVYGVTRAFSSFVSEAAEAEAVENRLRFALETTGYTWQYAKTAVDEFASSIQASTRFSDVQARQSLTDMMMYTRDFSKAQMGAKLAMDMSVRTGHDLGSTSRLIGMAMSGNVEMLGRYIPELRNLDEHLGSNATMAQKAEYVMKIFNEKFGGTAQADLNTYAGQMAQLTNEWREFKKVIGGFLIGPATELIKWFKDAAEGARNFFERFKGPKTDTEALKMELDGINNELKIMDFWFERRAAGDPLFRMSKQAAEEATGKYDELLKKRSEIQKILEGEKAKLAAETKKDIFPEAKKEADIVKEVQGAIEAVTYAEEQRGIVALARHELIEGGWSKEKNIVEQVKEETANLERTTNEWGVVTVARQELIEGGWSKEKDIVEQVKEEIANLERTTNEWGEVTVARQELVEANWRRQAILGETLAQNMASAWNFNLKNIVTDSKNMGDAVRKIFFGMADAFSSAISKMISDWILFGDITGKTQKGGIIGMITGGLGSLLGGRVAAAATTGYIAPVSTWESMGWLQHGADFWATKPTIIGVGEGGRERVTVTPESKMESEGSQIIINIENKTGTPIKAKETDLTWDGKRWIKNVMLELAVTDMDIRSVYDVRR